MNDDFADPLFVARRDLGEKFDDLDAVDSVVLREGPRSRKIARLIAIKNRHTQAFHHHALTIESGKKRQGSWELDDKRSVTLSNDDADEIGRLVDFIQGARTAQDQGLKDHYVVVPSGPTLEGREAVANALKALTTGDQAALLVELTGLLGGDREGLRRLAKMAKAQPEGLEGIAAAINYGRFMQALEQLKQLIEEDAKEQEFQRLLGEHPWIFGSEYSELLDRRVWVRDQQQDFVLRRTADGYLEIIEIKTPLGGEPLLKFDKSHRAYYAGSELSQALGQVMHYLEEIDANRAEILRRDDEKVSKIRAKLIIGTDGDEAHQEALRRFNAHLGRVEVLTFEQLLRTGRRVLDALKSTVHDRVGGDSTTP